MCRFSDGTPRRSIGESARGSSRSSRRRPRRRPGSPSPSTCSWVGRRISGPLAREGAADRDAAWNALDRLELEELAERPLGTLSGGERQRAVVARALAQEASIVLLDEPTAALDIGHQQQALELLDGLRDRQGLTLVAAMHDLTLAAQYADRVLLLSRGRIVADGTPGEVLTEDALREHYGATVRVLTVDDRLAVLPTRG